MVSTVSREERERQLPQKRVGASLCMHRMLSMTPRKVAKHHGRSCVLLSCPPTAHPPWHGDDKGPGGDPVDWRVSAGLGHYAGNSPPRPYY